MFRKPYLPVLSFAALALSMACQKSGGKSKQPDPMEASAPVLPLQDPATSTPASAPVPAEPVGPGGPSDSDGLAEGETPVEVPIVIPTELAIHDSQFWIHTRTDDKLGFNTPWDEAEGDGIERDASKVPKYAQNCLNTATQTFKMLAAKSGFQKKIVPLLAQRATPKLTFLVVVVDNDKERDNLRRIDRDAYFWHWTNSKKKPVLGMSNFQKGSWVWEVIASPAKCTQPSAVELNRYLDYAAKRLAEKGAKI